jgi:hypothetical protein
VDPVLRGYYPPLPLATGREDLPAALRTLIWGWGILKRLSAAGVEEVRVSPFEGDARQALALMLSLEDRAGAYGLEEQRRILELCEACGVEAGGDMDTLVTGGAPFAPVVRRFAALPAVLREMVAAGELELKAAERLAAYPRSAAAIREATSGLSFSNRRRFATMLWEIAQRDRLSDEAAAALARELGASQTRDADRGRGAASLDALRRRRFPTLASLEGRFSDIAERALGGTGVELSPPANFEGGRFTVSFSFATKEELEKRRRAITRLEDEIDELSQLL